MEKYVIKGGNVLEGEVSIAGAKNAALGILAAAVMTDEECIIENVPYVEDTKTLLRAIETIGAKVKYIDNHTVLSAAEQSEPARMSVWMMNIFGRYEHPTICLELCLVNTTMHRLLCRAAVILDCVRSTSISRALRHLVRSRDCKWR
mgnify:CR=1 FL=1